MEGFYVHPELVKPILESNLKKEALQKWKNAERLTDDQFEKLIDRFEKHPAKPQNYLPKKICIAESVKRRFERVKALKIPWTPPFEGPNPIDCKPMEPEKPTCCACQPHPEARAAGGGTEDFGDRASRPGDPPKNFDPKKANFNDLFSFLQASVKKVSNFLHLVSSEPDKSEKPEPKALGKKPEPETVSKTSKTGEKRSHINAVNVLKTLRKSLERRLN